MENNHYLCIVKLKEINNMSKKMTKLGSVNPCNVLSLCDNKGKVIGECFDTPNAFACACYLNDKVEYGKAYYDFFGLSMRYKSEYEDQISLYKKQAENGNMEDINYLKQEIKFY